MNLPLLLLGVFLGSPSLAGPLRMPEARQDTPAPQDASKEDPAKGPKKLEAWPELEDGALAKREVQRLRKARTEEMGAQAHASLVEFGAGCAPLLMEVLEKEKNEEALERTRAVLDLVTDARHTRLVAEGFDSKGLALRLWSLRRAAAFPDAALLGRAEGALESARERKKGSDAELLEERRVAAMACAASGSMAGLDLLTDLAREEWGEWGSSLRTALEGSRGPKAGEAVSPLLRGDRRAVVAGLRLLAGCGDASVLGAVAPHLDSSDNSIRVEAINACRGIVDGDLPIARLSAFEAIEVAKQWRARL
jgi:hypothetical protein